MPKDPPPITCGGMWPVPLPYFLKVLLNGSYGTMSNPFYPPHSPVPSEKPIGDPPNMDTGGRRPAADFDRHRTPAEGRTVALSTDEQATRLASEIMAEFRRKHGLSAIGECSGLAAINDAMRECAEEINAIARGIDQARISPEAGRMALAWYLDPATIEKIVTVPGTRVRWL